MINFDEMTDEEVEAYLAQQDKSPVVARGAREFSIVLMVSAILGLVASIQLLLGELELKADPAASLVCDVNELLACSTFLNSWEGSLLGISNSYVGIAGFIGMLALGAYLFVKKSLPRVMWSLVGVAAAVSVLALFWFQYTSFIVARTLCPWCLVIWAALIPFITQSVGQVRANLAGQDSVIWKYRWAIIVIWIALVVGFGLFYFYDTLARIYGW